MSKATALMISGQRWRLFRLGDETWFLILFFHLAFPL